jgi:hypothetical protein
MFFMTLGITEILATISYEVYNDEMQICNAPQASTALIGGANS